MVFTTDKQTLDDLNIFGRQGGESIYQVFNRTSTRGGALILEELFRYPLSHPDAINRRSGIIRGFTGTEFPFSPALFDAIDSYLSNTDERTKLPTDERSITSRLSQLIAVDADTALIYKGVAALVQLLKAITLFLASIPTGSAHPYDEERSAILRLLQEPDLALVIAHPEKVKLAHNTIAAYDLLLRFRHRDTIQQILQYVYRLDVYCSIARVARERNFVFAKALPKQRFSVSIDGVYHPQVKGAVPNSIEISPGNNVLFLTGANMAGKSTFMKSLSIALFLAHMGFPVAAARMEFSVLDGMYTTINLPDNLGMGASHFYAEVLRVKKVAGELQQGKNIFVVFDELFRGTNVKDAHEASRTVSLSYRHISSKRVIA
jgi:DNA mismatch repair ATPase MutS